MVAATGVAAVVGVATVEVAVAVAATVGAVTRSLQRRWAEGCGFGGDVVAGEGDDLHAGKGGGDDRGDMTAIVLPGRDEKKKTKTKKNNLSKCFQVGVGPVAAVGGAAVWVVAVVAASGQRREQVVDVEATGSVWSRFQRRQGLARLEGGVGASERGRLHARGGDGEVMAAIVLQRFELKI